MHLPTTITRPTKSLIALLGDSKLDRLTMKVLLWVAVIDLFLLPAIFVKVFFNPWEKRLVAVSETAADEPIFVRAPISGPAMTALLAQLKNDDLTLVLAGTVTRRPFAVRGRTIALNGDSLQAFEYPDQAAAARDAAALASAYATSTRKTVWNKMVHIYVSGTLVAFYMGNQDHIVSALDQALGSAFTQPVRSLSAISKVGN